MCFSNQDSLDGTASELELTLVHTNPSSPIFFTLKLDVSEEPSRASLYLSRKIPDLSLASVLKVSQDLRAEGRSGQVPIRGVLTSVGKLEVAER